MARLDENSKTSKSIRLSAKTANPKTMPNNLEAEQAVLCCAMIDKLAAEYVIGQLSSSDFYSETHRIIFDAMQSLYNSSKPIDFISVQDELNKSDRLESVGGINYLISITNALPSSAYHVHYTKIVKRDAILRHLIEACNKIIVDAYEATDLDVVDKAEKLIFEIGEKNVTSGLENLRPAFNDSMSTFEEIFKNGANKRGIRSGFFALDKKTGGFQKTDLIVIAARPGIGKTSLAMNIVTNAAIQDKAKCAIFSLEMSREQLAQRMLCSVAGVDMGKARLGELTDIDWQKLWKAHKKLMDTNIYCDANSLSKPSTILSQCRKLKRERGLDLIVVDYLQLMTGDKKSESRQNEVSDMSRQMKILAKELDVPVIVLSQLSRAVQQRQDHRPVLSDLRESGAIEQDADMVIFIDRKDVSEGDVVESDNYTAELIIAKFRNGEPGSVSVGWDGSKVSFVNLAGDENMRSLEATYEAMHATAEGDIPEGFEAFADIPQSELPTDFEELSSDIASSMGQGIEPISAPIGDDIFGDIPDPAPPADDIF